jgi:mycofactocin precursor
MAATMRTGDELGTDEIEQTEGHDAEAQPTAEAELLESDLLVEDVSIDGMCGVY